MTAKAEMFNFQRFLRLLRNFISSAAFSLYSFPPDSL